MRPPRGLRVSVIGAISLVSIAPGLSQGPIVPEPAQSILLRDIGFTPGQLVLIRNGQAMARTLETDQQKEIAVAGAVRVAVTKEEFFTRYRDIERFKHHKAVLQIGRFSAPPSAGDMARLTLSDEAIDALRTCEPGRCKVRLPAEWMADFRRLTATPESAWRTEALSLFRSRIAAYVTAYQEQGAAALAVYADKSPAVSLAEESNRLLERSTALRTASRDFQRYLLDYPRRPLPLLDTFFYWSKEDLGLKPVVSVTHVSIHQDPAWANTIIVAARQIYATHYVEASLGLTFAIDAGETPGHGIYLVYVNRTQVGALKGQFAGMRRSLVRGRAKDALEQQLGEMKQRLESGAR
ncbi:MAG: hypothetical protein NTY02_09835 [Acidobacteria bacterium]|nr:hypothetical protein [Acidobacteriota bacterium]